MARTTLIQNAIPSLVLGGEEGSWEVIAQIIERQILPALDRVGAALFLPQGQPAPANAHPAPIENYPTSWYRKCPQIAFVVRGEEQIIYRGKLFHLRAPQGLILFKTGDPHISHVITSDLIPFRDCLWFDFLPSGCVVHRCQLSSKEHRSGHHYMLIDSRLAELFHELEDTLNQPSSDTLIAKSLLMALFSLLVKAQMLPLKAIIYPPQGNNDLPFPLQKALQIIHRSYNRPFSLKRLAQACSISPFHFCRMFKTYLGVTPLGYLTQLRLKIAHKLLETSTLTVAEVAHLVGYSNPAYLTHLFYKYFGVPPTNLRPRLKPIVDEFPFESKIG